MDRIPYMGTKKWLADEIADVVVDAVGDGVVLDLFSGMCAIGETISPHANIWNNDAQSFAYTYAKTFFNAPAEPINLGDIQESIEQYRFKNSSTLKSSFRSSLRAEGVFLDEATLRSYRSLCACLTSNSISTKRRKLITDAGANNEAFPYCLFTAIYANTYFGVAQAIEADSIVYAIHKLRQKRRIRDHQRDALLLGLGRALLKVSTTTGHFAQYQSFTSANAERFIYQRKRDLFSEWIECCALVEPIGTAKWRSRNKAFCGDAVELLQKLRNAKVRPSIIYADPPYTTDQYSRYYHLLESLVRYDYPQVTGKAMYRTDRFRSAFSLAGSVSEEFQNLVYLAKQSCRKLIVSYPANGLLFDVDENPYKILKENFKKVDVLKRRSHQHSTFGASKGAARTTAMEKVYYAHF